MQSLEPPDSHFLSAAIGWLELGNLAEAKTELAQIQPEQQRHPDVLEVRWAIAQTEGDWAAGLEAARALVEAAPDQASGWLHRAYALRRVAAGGLQPAWDALLPAAEKFPDEPTIPYNLACYATQMQDLEQARQWLQRAIAAGGKELIQEMALQDDDLAPLWAEIRQL